MNLLLVTKGLIAGTIITAILVAIIGCIRICGKSAKAIWKEFIYEVIYGVLGLKALLEDAIMKEKDRMNEYPDLSGKVAVITGGARGIGVEVVKKLLKCNLNVIMGCRSVEAAETIINNIRKEGIATGDAKVFKLDLCNLESVKAFAERVKNDYSQLNILINNAGKMFGPYSESVDGYESQFATNYLGHFLLTHLLLPELIAGGESDYNSRIVNVSSCAHLVGDIHFDDINLRKQYIPSEAYAQSKLAQILFTNHLNDMLKQQKLPVCVFAVHPGIVDTDLFNGTYLKNILGSWIISYLFKTPEKGSTSIVHAGVSPLLEGRGGYYISNCQAIQTSKIAYSTKLQKQMFDFTNDLLSIKEFGSR